jgi:hypothetical protein
MKTALRVIASACLFVTAAFAQNWTTVSAANITDLNQNKLAAGQLCFLGTDQNDNPISFSVGGGGQVLRRAFCSAVTAGAVTAFTVPNPASTQPAGVYYRVTVKDTSTGLEVLRYTQVTFTGTTFSFDNYAPANLGNFAPLTGNSVSGNLSVSGNTSITGSLTAGSFTPTVISSGQFTSNTASPAGAGIVRLASSDTVDWRNNANAANIALAKTGAAAGGVPADTLDASGFGGLKLTSPAISAEAAAPSGVAAADVLYADSTAHRWKMINNNGGADTVLGAATTDTLTNKTLSSPVINGSPTGTGIPTVTLKKGLGTGNYTTSNAGYVPVDGTNLTYTVTIPTGWKLAITASGFGLISTAQDFMGIALADGGGIIVETFMEPSGAGPMIPWSLNWVITGDGNAHTIDLRFRAVTAAHAANIVNSSSTQIPTVVFMLTPSN